MSIPSPDVVLPKIVQAGAGTGKTESLASEIIMQAKAYYQKNARTPRFVATTFTERATAELRERVIMLSEKEENKDLLWLSEFVKDQERLQISTLHGVFSILLHKYGAYIDLDPEFKILSADEENELLSVALRNRLAKAHLDEPVHFLVGQYSFNGLLELVERLIGGYRLHGDDFLHFKNWEAIIEKEKIKLLSSLKSACQITESDKPSPSLQKAVTVFKNLLPQLERVQFDFTKFRNHFLENTEGMRKPALKGDFETHRDSFDFIYGLKKEWEHECYSPDINIKFEELAEMLKGEIKHLSKLLDELKLKQGVASFSDLEFLVWELIKKKSEVKSQISSFYDHWFVDEYQDTSPLQKKILFSLFKKSMNAYFVGDPQQSIYLFRGSDQNVFEDTKKLVLDRGGSLEKLETNYRSDPDLLAFMNLLFSPLKAKGEKSGKTLAKILFHIRPEDEGVLVYNQIVHWLSEGFVFEDICVLTRTNKKAKELAHFLGQQKIPVYVHATGGFYDQREVLDALSLLKFIIQPHDDINLAILLRSPWASVSDTQIASWAQRAKNKKVSFWSEICSQPENISSFYIFSILSRSLDELKVRPLSCVFEEVIESLGFFELSLLGDSSGKREANLRKLVSQLRQAETHPGFSAHLFIKRAWPSKNNVNEESEASGFIEPRRVNLMTVHKSKGLKFNCVIVPGCGGVAKTQVQPVEISPEGQWAMQVLSDEKEEKISPLGVYDLREKRGEREAAESMRLFYVAVTRAAHRLCLLSEKDFSEKSWMAKLPLELSDGFHPHYEVGTVDEATLSSQYQEEPSILESTFLSELKAIEFTKENLSAKPDESTTDLPFILKAQQRGVALHTVFEVLKKSPTQNINEVIKKLSSKLYWEPEMTTEMEKTMRMVEPPLSQIMLNGFAEWSFNFKIQNMIFAGQIDLWGEVDKTTWILDYKSAKNISQTLIHKTQKQLNFYALAVSKMGIDLKNIRAGILLPQAAKFQEIKILTEKEIIDDIVIHRSDHLISDQISALPKGQ